MMIVRIIQSLKRFSPTGFSLKCISYDNEPVPLRRKNIHKYVICMVFDSGSNCLQLLYSFILKCICFELCIFVCCVCVCFICFSERLLGNQPTWTNFGIGCCGKGFINYSSLPYGTPYPSRNTLPHPKASAVLWFCHVIHLLPSSSEKQYSINQVHLLE